jgi:3-oxoadipyl-CoA thiolase
MKWTFAHPRPQTTLEQLFQLKPIVRSDGTVTAGNSSGLNDGSAAMILALGPAAVRNRLKVRARILGMASAGVAPRVMGIGPVSATRKLLARLGLAITHFDLIEINEAFAAKVIASARLLELDPFGPSLNPNGGAIALGHPLGASGARLVLTALNMLEEQGRRRALVTMCVGVGQGLSIAIERLD